MGNRQSGLVDRLAAVEQQVEIDRPRTPPLAALTTEPALDLEQRVEQLPWREAGLETHGAVQERRLLGDSDRLGLAQLRDRDDAGESGDRRADRRLPVAEIRAESDVGDRHGRVARTAAYSTGDSRTTWGFRTRTGTRAAGKRASSSSARAVASASSRWYARPSETARTQAATSR